LRILGGDIPKKLKLFEKVRGIKPPGLRNLEWLAYGGVGSGLLLLTLIFCCEEAAFTALRNIGHIKL
jgi:hypothetical protein